MTETSGIIGLSNLGNTCFMNACLQIFSHTHELTNILNSTSVLVNNKNTEITKSNKNLLLCWKELQKLLWNKPGKTIAPRQFHKAFQENCVIKKTTNLLGLKQHDASEFIEFFMDGLHGALSREVRMTIQGSPKNTVDKIAVQCYETMQKMYAKDYSNLIPLFFGMYITEIISVDTGKTLCYSAEPFSELTLSIPILQDNAKIISLKQCIDLHCSSEIIRDYLNEKTKQRETIQRRIRFWSLPRVLIITLKRYNNVNQKNNTPINCPKMLNMSEYAYKYQSKSLHDKSYIYNLYGVCQHHGTTRGGHYTACVKHATTQKWYMYNDAQVTCIHENPQLDAILLQGAYCLFYRVTDM